MRLKNKEDLLNVIHNKDARNILDTISSETKITTTITSPPYYDMKDYDSDNQVGYGQTYDDYLNDLQSIFAGVYKITEEDGTLWIIIDTFKRNNQVVPLPFDLSNKLKEVGWLLQDVIIWKKDKTVPWSTNGFMQRKFEANLFLEINSNQKNVPSQVQQEIELMISPFSTIAIGKRIMLGLNKSGPLGNLIEQFWYEKGKIKTASIVSFGLRPLIKIEDLKAKDSIYALWSHPDKHNLKKKDNKEFELLDEYVEFSTEKVRDLLIALKTNLSVEQWKTYSPSNPKGLLSVTFINGILNVLRLLIQNNKVSTTHYYKLKLADIGKFDFKQFKSSQYRKMGETIYNKYF
ncbi:MAG: DNA methyltransferase [Reichenbachiella sp.]|uniref:DNA methyltransferase n=1 Tax=Reichenbachiella sp. TaxID=2184521 RepID=UPI002966258F|nr:DNA methyltransferase [Reichenbachiella sp.]MDW3209445.1 DNA methyltransferase [Reichenbachiella sp.]